MPIQDIAERAAEGRIGLVGVERRGAHEPPLAREGQLPRRDPGQARDVAPLRRRSDTGEAVEPRTVVLPLVWQDEDEVLGPAAVEADGEVTRVRQMQLVEIEAVICREVEARGLQCVDVEVRAGNVAALRDIRSEQRAVGLAHHGIAVSAVLDAVGQGDVDRERRDRIVDGDVEVVDAEVEASHPLRREHSSN